MESMNPLPAARWASGVIPNNVEAGLNTIITGPRAFQKFRGTRQPALVIGQHCTLDGVSLAINPQGFVQIGDYCAFYGSVILCELEVRIGQRVVMGWNTVISDSDFHPTEPAERLADSIACSMLAAGRPRRPYPSKPVVIEDDVYVGHAATILKGVTVGTGAFIEPGAMVTRDVPAGMRVMGNPAQIIGPAAEAP